jgi:hypothetical protein
VLGEGTQWARGAATNGAVRRGRIAGHTVLLMSRRARARTAAASPPRRLLLGCRGTRRPRRHCVLRAPLPPASPPPPQHRSLAVVAQHQPQVVLRQHGDVLGHGLQRRGHLPDEVVDLLWVQARRQPPRECISKLKYASVHILLREGPESASGAGPRRAHQSGPDRWPPAHAPPPMASLAIAPGGRARRPPPWRACAAQTCCWGRCSCWRERGGLERGPAMRVSLLGMRAQAAVRMIVIALPAHPPRALRMA